MALQGGNIYDKALLDVGCFTVRHESFSSGSDTFCIMSIEQGHKRDLPVEIDRWPEKKHRKLDTWERKEKGSFRRAHLHIAKKHAVPE